MAKKSLHDRVTTEHDPLPSGAPQMEIAEDETTANGEQPMGVEPSYTDKKGEAWRRLMRQRYPKAVKALERLCTLGSWVNYHYTQAEAATVVKKLRKLVAKIETAHQRTATVEQSPLSMPWEE